jgi:hypothetical protein
MYAWKLVAPGSGEPTTKEMNKNSYHFCMHHNNGIGEWVIRHPSKCGESGEHKGHPDKKDKPDSNSKEHLHLWRYF